MHGPTPLCRLLEPGEEQERFREALVEAVNQRAVLLGLEQVTSRELYQEALARATSELMRAHERLAATTWGLEQRARGFEALRVLKRSLPDEPAHEDVCRAAAEALGCLLPGQPAGLAVYSAVRQMVWVAATGGAQTPELQCWPAGEAPLVEDSAGAGPWISPAGISRVWADRIGGCLAGTLAVCRRLGSGTGWGGVVCVTDPIPADREALDVLCDWIETWLAEVEHRTASQRLSEELSQINRRLAETQAEAARMRSLAMVGRMAAGAAHELNNPLAVISGRAQLLASTSSDEDIRQVASTIAEQADRASGIISDLMAFAKPPQSNPTVWSAAELLHRVREDWVARGELSEKEFELHISDDHVDVRADESQIRMLLDELVRNATEAMQDVSARRLVINCWKDVTDDKVMIRVEDNGCGMPAEVVERAADPFFSHRAAGRGRGLGLSRAVRYAEINGGAIRLASVPGEGTKVLVTLPSA